MRTKITFFIFFIIGSVVFLASPAPLELAAYGLNLFLPGSLKIADIQGNLFEPITISKLTYHSVSLDISAQSVSFNWSYIAEPYHLILSPVNIRQLYIKTHPAQTPSPQKIGLPFNLDIQALSISRFTFNEIKLHNLKADINVNKMKYTIQKASASLKNSRLDLTGHIGTIRPFDINASFTIHNQISKTIILLNGSILNLNLDGNGEANHGKFKFAATLSLSRRQPLGNLKLKARNIDLHPFYNILPTTSINADLTAQSNGSGLNGMLNIKNSMNGPFTEGRIPISSISALLSTKGNTLVFSSILVNLNLGGVITGTAHVQTGMQELQLEVKKINLKAFNPKLYPTALNGIISFINPQDSPRLNINVHDPNLQFSSALTLHQGTVSINSLNLNHNFAMITTKGEFGINNETFNLSGNLSKFNPAAFGAYVPADVGANFQLKGKLKPKLELNLVCRILPNSSLNHHHLSGHILMVWKNTLGPTDINLRAGTNRITLKGELSQNRAITLHANLPKLDQIGKPFSGQIYANGSIAGTWRQLTAKLQIKGHAIHLPNHIKIGEMEGNFLISKIPTSPFITHLALKHVDIADHPINTIKMDIMGSRTQHHGLIWLSLPKVIIESKFEGTITPGGWSGRIISLNSHGIYHAKLISPARLTVSAHVMSITGLNLKLNGGSLILTRFLKTPTSLKMKGHTDKLPVSALIALWPNLPIQADGLTANSKFDFSLSTGITGKISMDTQKGDINLKPLKKNMGLKQLHIDFTVKNNILTSHVSLKSAMIHSANLKFQAGIVPTPNGPHINIYHQLLCNGKITGLNTEFLGLIKPPFTHLISNTLVISADWNLAYNSILQGHVSLQRQSGDLIFSGFNGGKLPLDLKRLSFEGQFIPDGAYLNLVATGMHIGSFKLNGILPLTISTNGISPNRSGKISLISSLNLNSLGFLPVLFNDTGMITEGSLSSEIDVKGTLGAPTLSGRLSGHNLKFSRPDIGLSLKNGSINATLSTGKIDIHSLYFSSANGNIEAKGPVMFKKGLNASIDLILTRIPILNLPNQKIIASGQTQIELSGGKVNAKGNLTADSGTITLENFNTPSLDSDVVVIGKKAFSPSPPPLPVNLDITLSLGNQFKLQGRGINTRLTGNIRASAKTGYPLQLTGTIHSVNGTYEAYGQNLVIEHGTIIFDGPTDNPNLNLVAIRKNLDVQPGVSITGTAQQPIIRLISTPNLSDSEKLSWLVLGHGLSSADSEDIGTLGLAAAQLLASGATMPLGGNLAQFVGLNKLSLSGSGSLQNTVINIGKQFSHHFNITYAQSLTGQYSVKIRYLLDKSWSIETSSGIANSINLLFTHDFD